ncbi:EsaB/YukD family protein [Lachnospiraceae bacterium 64-25]
MKETLTVIFANETTGEEMDLEIPLYITADELIRSLNKALMLGIDMDDMENCFLRIENPIALLRGDRLLKDFHLRTGTKICYAKAAEIAEIE